MFLISQGRRACVPVTRISSLTDLYLIGIMRLLVLALARQLPDHDTSADSYRFMPISH